MRTRSHSPTRSLVSLLMFQSDHEHRKCAHKVDFRESKERSRPFSGLQQQKKLVSGASDHQMAVSSDSAALCKPEVKFDIFTSDVIVFVSFMCPPKCN